MQPLGADEPTAVGPYRLLGRLGSGGMGRVYLGRSAGGRTVAVKIVHPHFALDEEFRARFRREVEAARRVGGAWTTPVLDADPEAPVPWVATAYAAGPSLAAAVADAGPLPVHSVRVLGAGLAEALAEVHRLGLVHRDVKPSNVLLTPDGPLLIDFGIARATDGTASLTSTGVSIGSPGYMSPEQILGKGATGAADVFSLGAVLAYAAGGRPPFPGDSSAALLYKVVHEEPELDALSGDIRDLVEACLAKDPGARPAPAGIARRLAPEGAAHLAAGGWLPGRLVEQVSRGVVRLLNLEAAGEAAGTGPGPGDPAGPGSGPVGFSRASVAAAPEAGAAPRETSGSRGAPGDTPHAAGGGPHAASDQPHAAFGGPDMPSGAPGVTSGGPDTASGGPRAASGGPDTATEGTPGTGRDDGKSGPGKPGPGQSGTGREDARSGPGPSGPGQFGPPPVMPPASAPGTPALSLNGPRDAVPPPSSPPQAALPAAGPLDAAPGALPAAAATAPGVPAARTAGDGPGRGGPGRFSVTVAAGAAPGAEGRGRRLSCSVVLAVAGALAVATTVGGVLLSQLHGGRDGGAASGSAPGDSGTRPTAAATAGEVPSVYLGTWRGEGTVTALGQDLPGGTYDVVVRQGHKGAAIGSVTQTDALGGACVDVLTLKSATDRELVAVGRGRKDNPAHCVPDAHEVRLRPDGDALRLTSADPKAGDPKALLRKVD
ncbi:protein kinase domain-containing protein [Streptomyces sp. NPDC003374]